MMATLTDQPSELNAHRTREAPAEEAIDMLVSSESKLSMQHRAKWGDDHAAAPPWIHCWIESVLNTGRGKTPLTHFTLY